MKRATRNLIPACGLLVALGGVGWWQLTRDRSDHASQPVARETRTSSRERTRRPIREMDAMQLVDLARRDPESAAKQAVDAHPEALAGVIAHWAEMDIAAAESWAKSLEGKLREQVLGVLVIEAVRADAEAAGRIAVAMEEGPAKNEAYAFVAAQWAAQDAEGALAWTRAIASGDLRECVERRAIPAIAQDHPLLAATYTAEEMLNPQLQAVVVPEIIGRWVQTDPLAAAAWIQQMDEPAMRERSLRVLLDIWNERDPDATKSWLDSLPDGPFRDQVIATRK